MVHIERENARCFSTYRSPLGEMIMISSGEYLSGLYFKGQKYCPALEELHSIQQNRERSTSGEVLKYKGKQINALANSIDNAVYRSAEKVFDAVNEWLDKYFTGQGEKSSESIVKQVISLERLDASGFRRLIWHILLTIPYGETVTYGDVAKIAEKEIGHRIAPIAVGQAVGHNPISIIIPCHRVIGAGGTLTGYAGGLERKAALLKLEL